MLTEYKNILVALDGSAQSEKAFKEAIEIAKRNTATLYLTWVINDIELTTSAYSFSKLLSEERAFVEDFMIKKIQEVKEAGIESVETVIEIGSPKRKIAVDIPEEHKIDLIVMGSTGKGAITQALVGSTTAYVVNHALCNVMVVK
ncbi:universal stress protein [Enterococcus lemanii]|jgi:nucleotide-binding universal stress UspA family protein|uniref:Universal stress protein n=1 Tax=Enterococcus lemanii TaxID=1159752 RepID=A0ABV9MXE1_9ENTE|nr:universal stress protein [Enterococcus lemanii]MBM7708109.1 nucleotide-binding universal stress UspA family protein [Enterococcus lemanii]NLM65948.1 universal stress protein [Enterococcus sp.]